MDPIAALDALILSAQLAKHAYTNPFDYPPGASVREFRTHVEHIKDTSADLSDYSNKLR